MFNDPFRGWRLYFYSDNSFLSPGAESPDCFADNNSHIAGNKKISDLNLTIEYIISVLEIPVFVCDKTGISIVNSSTKSYDYEVTYNNL